MLKEIFKDIFISINNKKIVLIKVALFYLIFIIATFYLYRYCIFSAIKSNKIDFFFIFVFNLIINIYTYTKLAVNTHRILILNKNDISIKELFILKSRDWNFIGYTIIIGIVLYIVMIIFSISISSLTNYMYYIFGFLFIVSIIISRIALVFPAVSVDKNISLSESWEYTKENKYSIYFILIVFPILFGLICGFVFKFITKYFLTYININILILTNFILNVIMTIITIATLSTIFKYILKRHPEYFIEKTNKPEKPLVEKNKNGYKITFYQTKKISFEKIKNILIEIAKELNYNNFAVNKDYSLLIKNSNIENSYISLSYLQDNYVVEAFNVKEDFSDKLLNLVDIQKA